MHRALRCACPMRKFPLSHFPPSESVYNLITGVVSGIFPQSLSQWCWLWCSFFSLVFTKCCLSWLSIIFTSPILILAVYFLVCNSFSSCCHPPNSKENLWLLDHQLLPNPPCIFQIISCLWLGMWCGWLLNQFFSIVCSQFLPLGLLVCGLFSEAKEWLHLVSLISTHLVELSLLGCMRFSPWLSSCWASSGRLALIRHF